MALAFAFAGKEDGRATQRLDALVGRGGNRGDQSSQRTCSSSRPLPRSIAKTILDQLMPEWMNLSKMIEQADANIKPSALFGFGLAAGFVALIAGAWLVNPYVAPFLAIGCSWGRSSG